MATGCSRNEGRSMRKDKPNVAGRPAPQGRKIPIGIRVTPDVLEFCRQHPQGFVVLEDKLRKSKEFRDWLTDSRKRGGKQR
jgi:alkanesulfonate monooxygenase SsuD/methylene tetrahydromethanopterin reductase-like flavin-dependent oxidoreductase (luciferase family)